MEDLAAPGSPLDGEQNGEQPSCPDEGRRAGETRSAPPGEAEAVACDTPPLAPCVGEPTAPDGAPAPEPAPAAAPLVLSDSALPIEGPGFRSPEAAAPGEVAAGAEGEGTDFPTADDAVADDAVVDDVVACGVGSAEALVPAEWGAPVEAPALSESRALTIGEAPAACCPGEGAGPEAKEGSPAAPRKPRPAHRPRRAAAKPAAAAPAKPAKPAAPAVPAAEAKAFGEAAAAGDLDRVKALLAANPALAQVWQGIMEAAWAGHVEMVTLLLEAGADPNALSANTHRHRPLHRVIEPKKPTEKKASHVEVVKALLAGGAEVSARGTWCNLTAAALAAVGGEKQFLPHLLCFLDGLDLFTAAVLGRSEAVSLILKRDPAKAKLRDVNGMASLHYCCASRLGHDDPATAAALARVATLLLNAGADVSAPADIGDGELRPPIDWAAASGNVAVLGVLLDRGADATAGVTPALWAAEWAAADYLVARGANLCDSRLGRMVSAFAKWGNFPQSRWLAERGADVNGRTAEGRTALHHACSRGASAEFVAFLLGRGADANALDIANATPLQLAEAKNKPKLVALLRDRKDRPAA